MTADAPYKLLDSSVRTNDMIQISGVGAGEQAHPSDSESSRRHLASARAQRCWRQGHLQGCSWQRKHALTWFEDVAVAQGIGCGPGTQGRP